MSPRRLIPGMVDRHGVAHPLPHCTGNCHGGRTECTCATGQTECALAVPPKLELVRSVPTPAPIQVSGGKVPFVRRFKRFRAALWDFFTRGCFEL